MKDGVGEEKEGREVDEEEKSGEEEEGEVEKEERGPRGKLDLSAKR